MTKLLCVYCSSSDRIDQKYFAAANALGAEMVTRGWGLVYGGGKTGLMGAVARAVKVGGGRVVGVIPEFMKARELAYDEADELVSCRRYFANYGFNVIIAGYASAASQNIYGGVQFQTQMRIIPSVSNSTPSYLNGSGWTWNNMYADGARGFFISAAAGQTYVVMGSVIANARV